MTNVEYEAPTMTRGDLKPDLEAVLGDDSSVANFSTVTPAQVIVVATMGDETVVEDAVDTVTPSGDGKTLRVTRAWLPTEVDVAGRMWVSFRVEWPTSKPQHFPEDTPLMLYIRPAPGDA